MFTASKAELKKQGVRYTAQSKKNRINVQLLKDFPGIGVTGQIVPVKASTMSNQLYPKNGAVYMNYKDAKPRIPIVTKAEAAAAIAALKAEQARQKANAAPKLNPIKKAVKSSPKILSLDQLLSIDLNTLSAEQLDLIFVKLPKKLIFIKQANESNTISPLEKSFIVKKIESVLEKYVVESDLVIKFLNSDSTKMVLNDESGQPVESIEKLGNYYLEVKHNEKEHQIALFVNSKA